MILAESQSQKKDLPPNQLGLFMKTLILVEGAVALSQSMFLLSHAAGTGVDFLSLFNSSMVRAICINQEEFWGDTAVVFST